MIVSFETKSIGIGPPDGRNFASGACAGAGGVCALPARGGRPHREPGAVEHLYEGIRPLDSGMARAGQSRPLRAAQRRRARRALEHGEAQGDTRAAAAGGARPDAARHRQRRPAAGAPDADAPRAPAVPSDRGACVGMGGGASRCSRAGRAQRLRPHFDQAHAAGGGYARESRAWRPQPGDVASHGSATTG